MVIHVIGTVNGQVNEGMRNVATHLAKEFEKENTVLYSGLKQIPQIVLNARRADVTMILLVPTSWCIPWLRLLRRCAETLGLFWYRSRIRISWRETISIH